MNFKLASASFALALLTSALPAAAGDFDYGGSIKDYGSAGVPVPAPVPLPVYEADWYIRGDVGYAFSQSGSVDVTGFPLNHQDLDDVSGTTSFSFGFGRYLTPRLRWDLVVDLRNSRGVTDYNTTLGTSIAQQGPQITVDTGGGTTATLQTTNYYNYAGDYQQRARVKSDTLMFNLYYDLDTGTRFKPYVGAGVGVAQHYIKSTSRGNLTCQNVTQVAEFDPVSGIGPIDPYATLACPNDTAPLPLAETTSATGYAFAGALMAGVATEVHPGVLLDVGYRMTYMPGTIALTARTPLGDSFIDVGDRIEHEIRTGLRFNIN